MKMKITVSETTTSIMFKMYNWYSLEFLHLHDENDYPIMFYGVPNGS